MSRLMRDGLGSAACIGAVLFALVTLDDRVRVRFGELLADASHLGSLTDRASMLGSAVMAAARDQSLEHAPLLVFSAAAALLVMFMVRT